VEFCILQRSGECFAELVDSSKYALQAVHPTPPVPRALFDAGLAELGLDPGDQRSWSAAFFKRDGGLRGLVSLSSSVLQRKLYLNVLDGALLSPRAAKSLLAIL
jgi:hypothetical protein